MGGADATGAVDDAARLQAAVRRGGRAPAPVRGGAPDGRPVVAAGGVRARPGAAARARARPRPPSRRPRRVALAGAALAAHLAAGRPDHTLAPEEWRRIFGFLVGAGVDRALGGLPDRGAGARGDRPAPTRRGAPADVGGAFRCAVVGAGASGLAAAHRLRQAGVDGHGVREERRRGRHLAGERVPGLPGRRAQPALQLLVRADQRLGLALLGPARPPGLPAVDGQGPRTSGSASASAAR